MAHEAASAPVHMLSGANAHTTTPAPARKLQLRTHATVSHPAPPPAKRPKHIAKLGSIEVTRAEMEPLVRALAQPSDEEQLVNAAIGFLVGWRPQGAPRPPLHPLLIH